MTISSIIEDLVATHGSQRAVARLLGLSESRLGKLLHADQNLSVYHCLILAKVSLVKPETVLRAAGKIREADLITELWGPSQRDEYPPQARRFLARWKALPPDVRALVKGLVEAD